MQSTIDNMRPSRYYVWSIHAMISRSAVTPSTMKLLPPAELKREVTPVPIAPSDGALEAIGMAVRVIKFYIAHYRDEVVLLRVSQVNNREIALRDKSDSHVLFLLQSFRAYGLNHAKENTLRHNHRCGEPFRGE